MNLVKKVLVAHAEPKLKRRLTLLLADAGYDVRAHVNADDALRTARAEWFDLALVGEAFGELPGLDVAEALKRIQPSVPIALLSDEPELSLVIKGIRLGLTDVLPVDGDLRPLMRRVRDVLFPDGGAPRPAGVTADELDEVEDLLERMDDCDAATLSAGGAHPPGDLHAELLRATRERDEAQAALQRVQHEKAVLEAELATFVSQSADATRQAQELADLHTQREMVAAAQLAIDGKARALAEQREEIARERRALQAERERVASELPVLPDWAESAEAVEGMRDRVLAEENRLRDMASELQLESARLARERRRWLDDQDLLREQEANLREYEDRLRKQQARQEAERVSWFSTPPAAGEPRSVFDDASLRDAWQKLQRASELLEVERAHLRDDRMLTREMELSMKRKEEALAAREAALVAAEATLRERVLQEETASPLSAPVAAVKSLTRGPFEIARSVFGGTKRPT